MFSFKDGVQFLGHPLHALLIHFPMGLLPMTLLWDIIGLWTGQSIWWSFSFWSMIVGVCLAVVAATPGFLDLMKIPEKHAGEKEAYVHMSVMLIAVAFFIGSILFRAHVTIPTDWHLTGALGCSILGIICLVVGGWYGGNLVYRHQLGMHGE